jgi:BMFP domain-containing protein YqiC
MMDSITQQIKELVDRNVALSKTVGSQFNAIVGLQEQVERLAGALAICTAKMSIETRAPIPEDTIKEIDGVLATRDARVRAECESLFAAMVRGLLEASDLASREDKHGIPSGILKHDARVRAETLRAAVSAICMGDFYSDTWAYGWMTCYDLFKGLADKAERGEWPEGK